MTDAALRLMDPDAFLEWCEHQEDKYELVDGVPVLKFDNGPEMMAGATERHDQVVVNVIQALRRLRGGPCRVKTGDQAARTARGIRRPDVTIDCGPSRPSSHESSEPTVLFEVLSPSTRRTDLLRKVDEYQHMPTLRQFVILEPDRAWAIVWSRARAEEAWSSDVIEGLDGTLLLPSVGAELPMGEVYEDVEFDA